METYTNQFFVMKNLLQSFANTTGLKANFSKYMMIPLNMMDIRTEELTSSFGCILGSLPITFLGYPLGVSKPRVTDFLPMVTILKKIKILMLLTI